MKGVISGGLIVAGILLLAVLSGNYLSSGQCTPGDTTWVWEKTCYGETSCKACCESDGSMEKHGWILDYCELTFTDLNNPSHTWTEKKMPGYTPCMWSNDYKIKVVNYYKCGGEQCTARHHKGCYNGDVYWYDSCDNVDTSDKWRECGSAGCIEFGDDAQCKDTCENKIIDRYCGKYHPLTERVELWQKKDCSTYSLKYTCPSGTHCEDGYCVKDHTCEKKLLKKYCSRYSEYKRVELWQTEAYDPELDQCGTVSYTYNCEPGAVCVDGECQMVCKPNSCTDWQCSVYHDDVLTRVCYSSDCTSNQESKQCPTGQVCANGKCVNDNPPGECEDIEEFPGEFGGVNVVKGKLELSRYFLSPKDGIPFNFPDEYISNFQQCCEHLEGEYGFKEHFRMKTSVYCDLDPLAGIMKLLKQYWYIAVVIILLLFFMRGRQQIVVLPGIKK